MSFKQKIGTAKCSRYKVQCSICDEIFDNDYVKKHTDLKHNDLHKQNRLAPVFKPGELKRKNPWSAPLSSKKRIVADNNPADLHERNDASKAGKTIFLIIIFLIRFLLFIKKYYFSLLLCL